MTRRDILQIRDTKELCFLPSDDFRRGALNAEEIRHLFEVTDALWSHSGDPAAPHAELTSGKCSDGFIDVLRALRFTNVCEIMASQLLLRWLRDPQYSELGKKEYIAWVIGSDHAGASFSHSVATQLGAQHDFTEKGEKKEQLWKRFAIDSDEKVLQVEELVTTTATLTAVREGIRKGNPSPVIFAPFVMTLVHRSSIYEFEGSPIIYLVHYDINEWDPKECPLCKVGSPRLRPKQNWKQLTQKTFK